MENKKFDFHEMPNIFFCDNKKSNALRNELIKNQVRISECMQGQLEDTFFSDDNIKRINNQLIKAVYENTNGEYKISAQSKQSLIIVMRYVFIENARHLPYDVEGQIKELNCNVVGEILPNVITNITQRVAYLNEIQNPRGLVPLPKSTNIRGKDLPSVSTILFDK